MYDLEEIKQTAAGQWAEIFQSLAGVDRKILDGKHHPCPKCGGNDRFRAIDLKIGGLFCNHCFDTKNGDGIAAVMWLLDINFKTALPKIGEYLGVKEQPKTGKGSKSDPAKDLKFTDWNPTLAGLWCLKKKPVTVAALEKIGARMAVYRGEFKVIALPIWRKKPDNITGWYVMNANGGTLPGSDGQPIKGKSTKGSKSGVIGWIDGAELAYKTEGPTDLLALVSILGDGACGFTNSNGAKENPAKPELCWLPDLLNGKEIRIIHDADQVGQDGATFVKDRPGWSPWLAAKCPDSIVKNILLPYEIEPTHGKDIRDWINEGGNLDGLQTLVDAAEPTKAPDNIGQSDYLEADDDPHRLAQINLSQYKKSHGGRLVFWRDEWWKYKAGKYQRIGIKELRAKINKSIREEFIRIWRSKDDPEGPVKKVTESLVTNVLAALAANAIVPGSTEMPSWLPSKNKKRHLISMENGILDLDAVFARKDIEDCLFDHTGDWFSPVKLQYSFDPTAECPKWMRYLETSIGDPEVINLLQEWAGYLLSPNNEFQKFMILSGEGKNGKSVFFAGLTAIIGNENISHVSLENFGGRFNLGTTVGKMANFCGDIGEVDNVAEGILKQYTGGDTMQFDRKGISPIDIKPTAKLMFSWNNDLKFRDKSYGLWRRIMMVHFNKKIEDKDKILGMDAAQFWLDAGEVSGMLNWALIGLDRLYQNGGFTEPAACLKRIESMKKDSNPALEFLTESVREAVDGYVESTEIYEMYLTWCKETGVKYPLGGSSFGKELRRMFPNAEKKKKRLMGQPKWCYKNIEFGGSDDDVEE